MPKTQSIGHDVEMQALHYQQQRARPSLQAEHRHRVIMIMATNFSDDTLCFAISIGSVLRGVLQDVPAFQKLCAGLQPHQSTS